MKPIVSTNPAHLNGSALLNEALTTELAKISNSRNPVARFVGSDDVPMPPAPAWYVPKTGDIYIHADEAGIDTNNHGLRVGFHLGSENFHVAKSLGLLAHEAAHGAISEDLELAERYAPHHIPRLTTIEEVRVENHALRRVPALRTALRASFTIILAGIRDLPSDKATVARAWALVQGRTLAGIATMDETKPMDEAARIILGDDVVDELGDLLQEAVTLVLPMDTDRIIAICDEWRELVGDPPEDGGGGGSDNCDADADGTGAKGKSAEGDTPAKGGDDAANADDDKLEEGDGGYNTGTPNSVKGGEVAEKLDAEGDELVDAALKTMEEKIAKQWSDPEPKPLRTSPLVAASVVFGSKTPSKRLTATEPTAAHRKAVLEVSQVLSNLALPAISKVSVAAELPPGRLRSREAVRASAERTQGRMVTAQPWKGTKRRHAVARPLIVGIATDTSGSMKWAEKAVAEFAYVYANAGHRIGARTAAVTFGTRVYPIARPGQIMSNVVGKPANDGHEACDYALAALDGVLHLTDPSYAARILVVVSDACLVLHDEQEKVTEWLEAMDKVGTHVLWVGSMGAEWAKGWVSDLANRLPNLTCVATEGYRSSSFDALNAAVLAAVQQHIR